MAKRLNIGGQVSGISTLIVGGVYIRSNGVIRISENLTSSDSKSVQTNLSIFVNDSILSTAIGDVDIKSDDGIGSLFTINGLKIDQIVIPNVEDTTESYGFSITPIGSPTHVLEVAASGATVQRTVVGGVSQTTIRN